MITVPPGMSFEELLWGNWDGFDMGSSLLDIDEVPPANAVPTILGLGDDQEDLNVSALVMGTQQA